MYAILYSFALSLSRSIAIFPRALLVTLGVTASDFRVLHSTHPTTVHNRHHCPGAPMFWGCTKVGFESRSLLLNLSEFQKSSTF